MSKKTSSLHPRRRSPHRDRLRRYGRISASNTSCVLTPLAHLVTTSSGRYSQKHPMPSPSFEQSSPPTEVTGLNGSSILGSQAPSKKSNKVSLGLVVTKRGGALMTRSNIHLSPNRILASKGEVVLPVTLGSPTALRAIFADLPKIWASANRSLPLSRADDSGVKASSSMIWWRASPISFRLL